VECEELLQQLADYLDEDARAELCREIEAHLARCANCQVFVDTMKKTIVLYQVDDRSRRIEVPVRANARLKAALATEYQKSGETIPSD
jgi:predicted anti-sigma-YlaC factor YlaD